MLFNKIKRRVGLDVLDFHKIIIKIRDERDHFMKTGKYLLIDKTFITEGMACEFSLFAAAQSDKEMDCIKESGTPITRSDKIIIDTTDNLYVHESEYPKYKIIRKSFLDSHKVKTGKNISFEEHASEIYKHASQILDALFNNPEKFANYEASQGVVSDMVQTVGNDNFTIKSLLQIATQDYHTHTHSINVTIYALSLGAFLNFKPNEL